MLWDCKNKTLSKQGNIWGKVVLGSESGKTAVNNNKISQKNKQNIARKYDTTSDVTFLSITEITHELNPILSRIREESKSKEKEREKEEEEIWTRIPKETLPQQQK